MKPLPKISRADQDATVEFCHPDVWQRDDFPGWSRLTAGARDGEIALIVDLCRGLGGPFGILYVLLLSRRGLRPAARYQSPVAVGHDELELFLRTYREYLEQDGRHHIWVMSLAGDGQIIFDNHNHLYLYGDRERYEGRLIARGFTQGRIRIASPHTHHYHPEFDVAEDELMGHWAWKEFPLLESDDP